MENIIAIFGLEMLVDAFMGVYKGKHMDLNM
jgi:hypothetical protein